MTQWNNKWSTPKKKESIWANFFFSLSFCWTLPSTNPLKFNQFSRNGQEKQKTWIEINQSRKCAATANRNKLMSKWITIWLMDSRQPTVPTRRMSDGASTNDLSNWQSAIKFNGNRATRERKTILTEWIKINSRANKYLPVDYCIANWHWSEYKNIVKLLWLRNHNPFTANWQMSKLASTEMFNFFLHKNFSLSDSTKSTNSISFRFRVFGCCGAHIFCMCALVSSVREMTTEISSFLNKRRKCEREKRAKERENRRHHPLRNLN